MFGGTAMMIGGGTSVILGGMDLAAAFSGGDMPAGFPDTYAGMILSPFGETASNLGDIGQTLAFGDYGSKLGITATCLGLISEIGSSGGGISSGLHAPSSTLPDWPLY